jgi:hypothetical protein
MGRLLASIAVLLWNPLRPLYHHQQQGVSPWVHCNSISRWPSLSKTYCTSYPGRYWTISHTAQIWHCVTAMCSASYRATDLNHTKTSRPQWCSGYSSYLFWWAINWSISEMTGSLSMGAIFNSLSQLLHSEQCPNEFQLNKPHIVIALAAFSHKSLYTTKAPIIYS